MDDTNNDAMKQASHFVYSQSAKLGIIFVFFSPATDVSHM
jgi:hypothetical protein